MYIVAMSSRPQSRARASTRNRLRHLVQPLVAPEVFDFWASRIHPTWSWQRPLARIVAREAASSDSVTLWLQPNRHCGAVQPGQHLNISAELDGSRVTRSYSPCVARRGLLAITVKRVDGGRLSRHLCDIAKVGDVLTLEPAFGDMVLQDNVDGELLFLAAGSGITPMIAMTRALAAFGMRVPLTLIYWTSTRAQCCFVDELRALAVAHPNFRVRFALTREAARDADEIDGRIHAGQIDALLSRDAQHVSACGPADFVAAARELLEDSCASFRAEAFSPPRIDDHGDEGHVSVTLARSGRVLQLARGQSLLVALEAEGLKPAHGCRMGICNTCACGKQSGVTRHLPSGVVSDAPMSALKLCIHSAVSPLVIDL